MTVPSSADVGAGPDVEVRPDAEGAEDDVPAAASSSLIRRILAYAPGSIVPAALTLVTSMIFTRVFDPAAFGVYSLFLVVANPVKLLATTWLTQSVGRFLPPEHTDEGRERVRAAVFVSTTAVLIVEVLVGGPLVLGLSVLLPHGWRSMLLPATVFVVASSVFDVLSLVFPIEYRAKEYTLYRLLDSVLTLGLRLVLVSAAFRMDVRLMFWSVVVSQGLLGPVMWRRLGLPAPFRLFAVLRREEVRRTTLAFGAFGLPMTVWFFSSVLLDVGDRYVLTYLRGPAAAGVYDANYRLIAGLAAFMVVPLTITLHPYLMKVSGTGDGERLAAVVGTVVDNLVLLGALCVGVTALLREDLARLLLGAEFRPGSVVMPLVLAGVFLFNVGTFVHKPFEIAGRTRVMVVFGLLSAAANVGFCFLLIPSLGYVGAAWATVLAYGLYTVCVGLLGRRLVPWRPDVRRLLREGTVIVACLVLVGLGRRALDGVPYPVSLAATVLACAVPAAAFARGLWRTGLVPR